MVMQNIYIQKGNYYWWNNDRFCIDIYQRPKFDQYEKKF